MGRRKGDNARLGLGNTEGSRVPVSLTSASERLGSQLMRIYFNWDTHQVLSGCSDDASTDLFVCKKNDTPAEID